jgi:hypothetical protein
MGSIKNMVKGSIYTAIYVVITLVIPLVTFSLVRDYVVRGVLPLEFEQEQYNDVVFWITALGLLICACAFFTYSSPKQSIRRGVFALIQVLVNSLYIWSYKFSGATNILFSLDMDGTTGFLALNLQTMVLVYMGIYFLTIVIKIYDLVDFTLNREKIREMRMKEG